MIYDNYIEIFKTYFRQDDDRENKNRFINELKECPEISPFELLELVSECNLKLDAHALCTLLLRKSHSLSHIEPSVIEDYFIPAISDQYLTEPSSSLFNRGDSFQQTIQYVDEIPYGDWNEEEKDQKRQQFCIKLAEFLRGIKK